MKRSLKQLFAAILTAIIFCASIAAQTTQPEKQAALDNAIESLIAVRGFSQVMISPDGARVAWVESLLGRDNAPSPDSAVYVADPRNASIASRRITAGTNNAPHAEHDIAWSPDDKSIAFLSDSEKQGQLQLYIADTNKSAQPRKLTDLTGLLSTPRFSPDGKSIAFLFTENAVRAAGPTQPTAPDAGVVEEKFYEQRLAIVDLTTGNVRQISPANLYVYEYDWSPDSQMFALTAAHGNGDDNWFIAELYTMPAASGETTSILKPSMQIAEPRFSPNGKSIAFIGGLMSDEGVTGGDIYALPATGGEARNLTPNLKASASWISWLPASNAILFTEHVDGASGIARLDAASGHVETLWTGAETISSGGGLSLSLARDSRTSAIIRHSFAHPPEVWAGQVGSWKQITNNNANLRPSWGEAKSVNWTKDNRRAQGWLLYPQNFDPARRYPMVVVVHGGPASQMSPRWGSGLGLPLPLASVGYFLFFPNPRGSYGQGEAFTRANVKDFGHGDLRDVQAGIDEVLKTVPVDENRLGLTGWSYGGFMTMWTVTQTNRFRAAAAGAGISNWQSYYGENGIDQWMIPYFGASVYDDPGVYAKSSPINFIKKTKTPTLVMVGDRDAECPAPQSYEFWHALKTLGVETQFVIYPNEGHAISQPEHRRDILRRAALWFDQHLQ